MVKYVIKTSISSSVLYLCPWDEAHTRCWTASLREAIKYDSLEEAKVVLSGPLKDIVSEVDTYEFDLSDVISDSLKSL